MSQDAPLAHSAPDAGRAPQSYVDHILGAVSGARANAQALAAYMPDPERAAGFVATVVDATTYHDLGKLDLDNQAALRLGRHARMRWDHVDAGVAHLLAARAKTAAWMVRAHHPPGLPARAAEFNLLDPRAARGLRGGRIGARDYDAGDALIAHTDRTLTDLVAVHAVMAGARAPIPGKAQHGLFMRLALSCMVDADHANTAWHEHGWRSPEPPASRWEQRLERLNAYVNALPKGGARQADRDAFYQACHEGSVEQAMVACEGAVGIGKTTGVAAWCLRRAIKSKARRIIIVAPQTTMLTQIAKVLRRALVLDDEAGRADEVVAEHHHRADFEAPESRDLAVLWRAPIVVTTSVQFFETLAACEPARLRKLHALPGSVVFLDEAHAALPMPLWRQNWAWMRELAEAWGCSFAFASGSLARVWEKSDIVGPDKILQLPDLVPPALAARLNRAEHGRVRFRTLGRIKDPVRAILGTAGPRLAIFNTVQTAAVVAQRLRQAGADVLHLSTALCPSDRDRVLAEVKRRLDPHAAYGGDWTLVATSLVEAGVDLSFRTALRERFSTTSLIQVAGRVNRHWEAEMGEVIDFLLELDGEMSAHPDAARPAAVLEQLLKAGRLADVFNAAMLVTEALRDECRDDHGRTGARLAEMETARDYPSVAAEGRLIQADTRLVVVDAELKRELLNAERVSNRELLAGSVQMWSRKIDMLGLEPLEGRRGVYAWPHRYDPAFLGYMAGALGLLSGRDFLN